MRMILWTIFGSLLVFGFVSLVVAAEGADVSTPDDAKAEPRDPDAGVDADGGVIDGDAGPEPAEAEVAAAPPPAPPPAPEVDEGALPPAETADMLPFGKGSMEVSLGVSLSGNGTENYLGVAGRFAYYVRDRLAPGIDVRYTHIFVDDAANYEYPESMTFLPFLKFVLTRKSVAPYVLATGGYEAEWGADNAVNAWILGLGAGVHVTVAKRVRINIELTALHYWYSDTKIYWYNDNDLLRVDSDKSQKMFKSDCNSNPDVCYKRKQNDNIPEGGILLTDSEKNEYICEDEELCGENTFNDKKDVKREWFFPLISVGVGVVF